MDIIIMDESDSKKTNQREYTATVILNYSSIVNLLQ